MQSVARRVSDKHRRGRIDGTAEFVLMLTMKNESPRHFDRPCRLHLIKMWLVAPAEEIDERGHRHRTTRNKDEKRGTPQGRRGRFPEDAVSVERLRTDGNSLGESNPPRGPISPLLSNLSMRRFLLGWKVQGHEQRLDAHIVNDADDFVPAAGGVNGGGLASGANELRPVGEQYGLAACCCGTAGEAMTAMRRMMSTLKLTVNETKTRQCRVPEESFDFLGYTIGRCYSRKTGRASIGTRPSKRKVQSLCREISEITSRRWLLKDASDRVSLINRKLQGWANYFCLGPVSTAYRAVDEHARHRLRQWLRAKHKVKGRVEARYPDKRLHEELGLTQLALRTRTFSWANT